MRSQSALPADSRQPDILSHYISRYIVHAEKPQEMVARKSLRILLRILAIIAGLTAGLPWIETAKQIGEESLLLQVIVAMAVMIGFGFTTAWAFSELTEKLKPMPEEDEQIRGNVSRTFTFGRHITCHFVGLTLMTPTVYMSYKYNTNMLYVPIAGLVSYSLSTVGLYKLTDMMKSFVNRKLSTISSLDEAKTTLSTLIAFNAANYRRNQDTSLGVMLENKNFLMQLKSAPKEATIQGIKHKNRIDKVTAVMFMGGAALMGLMNGLSIGVLMVKAFQATIPTIGLSALLLALIVVIPMFGLDYYASTETLLSLRQAVWAYLAPKRVNALLNHKHSVLYYAAPSIGLLVSVFSTLTDAYIVNHEISNSPLESIAFILAINMWFSKTLLETYSISVVSFNIAEKLDRLNNKDNQAYYDQIESFGNLVDLIKHSDDNVFSEYLSNHFEVIHDVLGVANEDFSAYPDAKAMLKSMEDTILSGVI